MTRSPATWSARPSSATTPSAISTTSRRAPGSRRLAQANQPSTTSSGSPRYAPFSARLPRKSCERALARSPLRNVASVGTTRLRRSAGKSEGSTIEPERKSRERVPEERGGDDAADGVRAEHRRHRAAQPSASLRHDQKRDHETRHQRDRQRREDLGREVDLRSQEKPEPQRERAPPDPPVDVVQHRQRDERHEEDRRQVRVPRRRVADDVAREAEQESAGERGPPRAGEVAAEEERRPRGQRRKRDGDDVVRDHGPGQQRHRRGKEREPRHRGDPREIDADHRPHRVRHERVVPVQDRVRPPAERPDEDLRVGEEADVVAIPVAEQRPPEEREREQSVDRERPDGRPKKAARGLGHEASVTLGSGRPRLEQNEERE